MIIQLRACLHFPPWPGSKAEGCAGARLLSRYRAHESLKIVRVNSFLPAAHLSSFNKLFAIPRAVIPTIYGSFLRASLPSLLTQVEAGRTREFIGNGVRSHEVEKRVALVEDAPRLAAALVRLSVRGPTFYKGLMPPEVHSNCANKSKRVLARPAPRPFPFAACQWPGRRDSVVLTSRGLSRPHGTPFWQSRTRPTLLPRPRGRFWRRDYRGAYVSSRGRLGGPFQTYFALYKDHG